MFSAPFPATAVADTPKQQWQKCVVFPFDICDSRRSWGTLYYTIFKSKFVWVKFQIYPIDCLRSAFVHLPLELLCQKDDFSKTWSELGLKWSNLRARNRKEIKVRTEIPVLRKEDCLEGSWILRPISISAKRLCGQKFQISTDHSLSHCARTYGSHKHWTNIASIALSREAWDRLSRCRAAPLMRVRGRLTCTAWFFTSVAWFSNKFLSSYTCLMVYAAPSKNWFAIWIS